MVSGLWQINSNSLTASQYSTSAASGLGCLAPQALAASQVQGRRRSRQAVGPQGLNKGPKDHMNRKRTVVLNSTTLKNSKNDHVNITAILVILTMIIIRITMNMFLKDPTFWL